MISDTVIQLNEKIAKKKAIRSFRDLVVWQKAVQLFIDVNADIKIFPKDSAAKIIENQILKSASSVSANIAEGYGRYKGKEFSRFLLISRGSLTETQDWVIKASKLGYMDELKLKTRLGQCEEIIKIINKMISKLRYQGDVD